MDFILKMVMFALKVLAVWAGFQLFWYIKRNGKDGIRMIGRTIIFGLKLGCIKVQEKLLEKTEKEPEKEDSDDPTKVEAHVI